MNTAAKAVSWHTLKRRALSLGAVRAFDQAMQFLLPVVLARCLDAATFGEYRLLWLAVGSVMAVATLNMCGTLYLFLPRSEPRRKRLFIHQTLLYLAAAGLVCGALLLPANPLLPAPVRPLAGYGLLVPAFVALWVFSTLLDYLPSIEERIGWQAWATGSVGLARAGLVAAGAWFTGDMQVILWLLLATVLFKLLLLAVYVQRWHGSGRPWFERKAFAEQFRCSAPFGVSNALFVLRAQSDQWVAASLFALSSFAAFSIGWLVWQVVHIVRHSVLDALLPSMSRSEAAGDVRGMMAMNSRANVLVGALLYPLLAFAFVFAEEIVTVVYTATYAEAAPVVRVYVLGMIAMAVEVGSATLLLRQGGFAMRVSALLLVASVIVSWSLAQELGLAGAAAGSVIALYLDRAVMLRRISSLTGIGLRRMQDWRSLAWALFSSVLAAAAAWLLVEHFVHAGGAFARAAIGGIVLTATYAVLNFRKLR
jgi:O-antigen/teichoic acid export membrane protein